MDVIRIKDLAIFAHHGVYERETLTGQNFLVSATLSGDFFKAAKSDNIEKAVDYGKICHFMHAYLTSRTYKLLETATDNLSRELLLNFQQLQKVELEIKKPEAPIGLPFNYVSVSTVKERHQVYVSIGSNIGDKNKNLENGIEAINKLEGCKVLEVSSVFKSKPYGNVDQEDFLNGAFLMETIYSPQELLKVFKELELNAGKGHLTHWGPRTLDLDILFFDDQVCDTKDLQVPHADMANRDFVLVPLAEIADFKRHPITKKTVREMLEELKASSPLYIIE
ncbi:dihydroneopterin aldolase/2-amino-4-hydroxy-6-hydroxymethyldihydropteridine diphosphokinase [Lachnospiraceae bacterium PF1-22]|uniref:2-amino-4-hydroxy-6- hydroxymethyldihydropteridine diphosphokinase n=1 Tax=Ohessyouella blattaphilus TaxID=2949333 RepID=UPI003E1843AF